MKRPACSGRQTGACRSCGPAACQPCRGHEEPTGATDALRPACRGRGAGSAPSQGSNGESKSTPSARPGVQRMRRSAPSTGRLPNGRSDQLHTAGRVSNGRRACHSNRRTWTEDEGPASTPSSLPALPAKDQRQLRFGSNSLVGDRGRANHPPVVPVQQGSCTQVSRAGNLGESLKLHPLSPAGRPWGRAWKTPLANGRQSVQKS